jgi:hypothetical protein
MQGTGVNQRFDVMIRESAFDERPIRDGTNHSRVNSRRNVGTDHDMASRAQARREKPTKPA